MEEHVKYYPRRTEKEALKGIQEETDALKSLLSPFVRISPELSSVITTWMNEHLCCLPGNTVWRVFQLDATSLFPPQLPPQKMTLSSLWPCVWTSVSLVHCKKVATAILHSSPLHNALYLLPLPTQSLWRGLFRAGGGWQRDSRTHTHTNHTDITAVWTHTPLLS